MSFYSNFTSTRVTMPDPSALVATLRANVDALAGVFVPFGLGGTYSVKKATAFSAADVAACQAAIDTAPVLTPQRVAQNEIDGWPIVTKALALTLLDQINVLRTALALGTITPAQAIAAIRAKAATL